jgi:hypothetical protein
MAVWEQPFHLSHCPNFRIRLFPAYALLAHFSFLKIAISATQATFFTNGETKACECRKEYKRAESNFSRNGDEAANPSGNLRSSQADYATNDFPAMKTQFSP